MVFKFPARGFNLTFVVSNGIPRVKLKSTTQTAKYRIYRRYCTVTLSIVANGGLVLPMIANCQLRGLLQ
jgi:hypothetical protein